MRNDEYKRLACNATTRSCTCTLTVYIDCDRLPLLISNHSAFRVVGLLRVTADIGSDVVRENHRSHDDSDELLAATAPHRVTLADVKTADHRDSLYVYATQGKSRHTRLWSLDQLLRSNSNLRLVDPKIERAMAQYCLTPDGVRDGLQNQLIILST